MKKKSDADIGIDLRAPNTPDGQLFLAHLRNYAAPGTRIRLHRVLWQEDVIVTAVKTDRGNYIVDGAGVVWRVEREDQTQSDGGVQAETPRTP